MRRTLALLAALLVAAAARVRAVGVVYVMACTGAAADTGSGGGMHSMHELHHTLRRLGMRSALVGGNGAWRVPGVSNYTACSAFSARRLDAADVLVMPEQRALGRADLDWLAAEERAGRPVATMVMYAVGQHREYYGYETQQFAASKRVCLSSYLERTFGCSANARWARPIAAEYYRLDADALAARKAAANDPVVLYDNDFVFPVARFRAAMPAVQFYRLDGWSQAEMHGLYQRARVLVDLHVPGLERASLEGAMYGVVPLLGRTQNGRDAADFPLPPHLRLDVYNTSGHIEAVRWAVEHYEAAHAAAAPLRRHIEGWRDEFPQQLADYFGDDVVFALQAGNEAEMEMLVPFAVAALAQHPYALVEALVPSAAAVRLDRAAEWAVLAHHGLASSVKLVGVGEEYLQKHPRNATQRRGVRNRQRALTCHVATTRLLLTGRAPLDYAWRALHRSGGRAVELDGVMRCQWTHGVPEGFGAGRPRRSTHRWRDDVATPGGDTGALDANAAWRRLGPLLGT